MCLYHWLIFIFILIIAILIAINHCLTIVFVFTDPSLSLKFLAKSIHEVAAMVQLMSLFFYSASLSLAMTKIVMKVSGGGSTWHIVHIQLALCISDRHQSHEGNVDP